MNSSHKSDKYRKHILKKKNDIFQKQEKIKFLEEKHHRENEQRHEESKKRKKQQYPNKFVNSCFKQAINNIYTKNKKQEPKIDRLAFSGTLYKTNDVYDTYHSNKHKCRGSIEDMIIFVRTQFENYNAMADDIANIPFTENRFCISHCGTYLRSKCLCTNEDGSQCEKTFPLYCKSINKSLSTNEKKIHKRTNTRDYNTIFKVMQKYYDNNYDKLDPYTRESFEFIKKFEPKILINLWRRRVIKKYENSVFAYNNMRIYACECPFCVDPIKKTDGIAYSEIRDPFDSYRMYCGTCNSKPFCYNCKYQFKGINNYDPDNHDDKTCEQVKQSIISSDKGLDPSVALIESDTVKCPECSVNIYRIDGCNHIICTMCNTHLCYLCKKKITEADPYDHYKTVDGSSEPFGTYCRGL